MLLVIRKDKVSLDKNGDFDKDILFSKFDFIALHYLDEYVINNREPESRHINEFYFVDKSNKKATWIDIHFDNKMITLSLNKKTALIELYDGDIREKKILITDIKEYYYLVDMGTGKIDKLDFLSFIDEAVMYFVNLFIFPGKDNMDFDDFWR